METGKVLVDTSILVEYFRKQKKETAILVEIARKHSVVISVITEFEWLVGFKDRELEFGKSLLKNIDVLPFDSKCALKARDIYSGLKSQNKLIEIPDIFIAATSLAYNLPLATINKNHFKRIAGVELV
ncbi:MAG: type II toxin-antitoxin system VapC family toxin [Nitrospirae bacterium]|nr:type II toxin-antitoxin system VapC family toxin [Nitrospirota bacterium]